MIYERVKEAIFLERPNRFIAIAEIDGAKEVCHVKNTGRCRELLIPGTTVYVQETANPTRKTKYDLIAVQKGTRLINMDSQAPNRAVAEFLPRLFPEGSLFRAEAMFGRSRFDFYVETPKRRIYLEVKGVTLEENGVVLFPDAPTERGVKHLRELMECTRLGYEAYLLFVIQMKEVCFLAPNDRTHRAFGEALREACEVGVRVLAYDCTVAPDRMEIADPVEIRFTSDELQGNTKS